MGLNVVQPNRIDASDKSKVWDFSKATTLVDEPVLDSEAATKKYVDDAIGGGIIEIDPLSIHLDQTIAQTFTGGDVTGSGLLKVTSGVLGLDETEYATPSDLGNYVPYAGATGDVDLGEYSLVNYVKMSWDEEIGAYLTF